MKTLAISLHRLGDLIMHAYVLKSLKDEKGRSVNLLVHPFYNQIKFIFPFISDVFIFEREYCQKSIGENLFNKNWPYQHIKNLVEKINSSQFDQIVDLSQSDTSARWMSFLNAKQKIGVTYDPKLQNKIHCSDNQWIHYLHSTSQSEIHFIDLFKKSLDLSLTILPPVSNKSLNSKLIIFQTLTSDIKKNWPPQKWIQLFHKLLNSFPEFEFKILSSSNEFALLKSTYSEFNGAIPIIVTNIEETFKVLQESHLIVTLDTAIKHLASWAGVSIVELALGSSNPKETGAYQDGAIILKTQVPCSPCRHSNFCSQPSYLCHNDLSVESVFAAIQLQLTLAREKKSIENSLEKYHLITEFIKMQKNNNYLAPIHFVETSEEGWWSCNSISKYEKGDFYERRTKKSVEVDY